MDPAIASDAALIRDALADIDNQLASMCSNPTVRELVPLAEKYRRAVEGWPAAVPSAAQRRALLACVRELRERTISVTPTVRPPPK